MNPETDISVMLWEERDEYVCRLLELEFEGRCWCEVEVKELKEYYMYAYDAYNNWGYELRKGSFTKAMLSDVRSIGGVPWWLVTVVPRVYRSIANEKIEDDEPLVVCEEMPKEIPQIYRSNANERIYD